MRRGKDSCFLERDGGAFWGVCLGSDFCAEHEFGINGLAQRLGVQNDAPGVAGRRAARPHPDCVALKDEGARAG